MSPKQKLDKADAATAKQTGDSLFFFEKPGEKGNDSSV